MFYVETHSHDPYYNLAFEEYILTNYTSGDYLILWQNENTIVVGQNQNTAAEINQAFVEQHGIRVVRRSTGGGAVYHDLGNLNYSFITDMGDAEQFSKQRFTQPVVDALCKLGLNAAASGRNDILVDDRKVSGTAQRKVQNRILHHGTLLFDSNPAMIAGALNADPTKFKDKSVKSVRSRVGNIRSALPADMDLPAFWDYLKCELLDEQTTYLELSSQELEAVRKLQASKYQTWEWNYGRTPAYTFCNKRRWNGGSLEVRIAVEKGFISDISFYGDFLSLEPLDPLTAGLRSCPYRKEDFCEVLKQFHLPSFFGSISAEEIIATVFHA